MLREGCENRPLSYWKRSALVAVAVGRLACYRFVECQEERGDTHEAYDRTRGTDVGDMSEI